MSPAWKLQLGDTVRLKKHHPCGEDRWEILRVGADFRIRCLGCKRLVMLPRHELEKDVKEVFLRPDPADQSDT